MTGKYIFRPEKSCVKLFNSSKPPASCFMSETRVTLVNVTKSLSDYDKMQLTVSVIELPSALLTLKRRHFLYSAVMTFHLRFQYLPSKIIAC